MSLFIGTAGWSIAARYAADFPQGGTHLERYAQVLKAVEINSSFYRPHQRKTYERWATSVPQDFRFAVKLPRSITHEARLVDIDKPLKRFCDEVAGLGPKLGVVLVQLPPSLAFNRRDVENLFQGLSQCCTAMLACEPRHRSWFSPKADHVMIESRVARVAADPALHSSEPGGWQGLVYFRLHGSPRVYYSDYGSAYLEALVHRLASLRAQGKAVWCIFDNTAAFAALGNALAVRRLYAGLDNFSSATTGGGAGDAGASPALSSERNSAITRMLSR